MVRAEEEGKRGIEWEDGEGSENDEVERVK